MYTQINDKKTDFFIDEVKTPFEKLDPSSVEKFKQLMGGLEGKSDEMINEIANKKSLNSIKSSLKSKCIQRDVPLTASQLEEHVNKPDKISKKRGVRTRKERENIQNFM